MLLGKEICREKTDRRLNFASSLFEVKEVDIMDYLIVLTVFVIVYTGYITIAIKKK